MKSFIQRSATIGLIGCTLLASWFGGNLKAFALSQEQILQKLNAIPLFAIGNQQGLALFSGKDKEKILFIYLSPQEAQKTVTELSQNNPSQQQISVRPISLGEFYLLAKNKEKDQNSPDAFNLVPLPNQVQAAQELLRKQDPQAGEFQGVPLFYAMIKKDGQERFMSFQNGEEKQTPFYFEKEALQQLVEKLKQQQPDLAPSIEIRVLPLFNLIAAFESDDKNQDEFMRSVILIRTQESEEFLKKIQQQNQSRPGNQQSAPNNPQK